MTLNGHFALKSGSSSASNGLAFWLSKNKNCSEICKATHNTVCMQQQKCIAQRLYWLRDVHWIHQCIGLDWIGLDWIGSDWVEFWKMLRGLDWIGSDDCYVQNEIMMVYVFFS